MTSANASNTERDVALFLVSGALYEVLQATRTFDDLLSIALERDSRSAPRSESKRLRELGKGLTPAEREAARTAAIGMDTATESAFQRAFEEGMATLAAERSSVVPGRECSPPSMVADELVLVNRILQSDGLREIFTEHFAPLLHNPAQMQYAIEYAHDRNKRGTERISSALLVSLVTALEDFLGMCLRAGLVLYPKALGELPAVEPDVLDRFTSTVEVKRYLIDLKVRSFLRGSTKDWEKQLKRWSGIDFAQFEAPYRRVMESVQRRHVVVHNRGVADTGYVSSVADTASLGDDVTPDGPYARALIRDLEVFTICFALRWANFLGSKTPRHVYAELVNKIVDMEADARWREALLLAETGIAVGQEGGEDLELLQANRWFCRLQLNEWNPSEEAAVRAWQPESDMTALARRILLGDHEEAFVLCNRMLNDGRQSASWLRRMPIIRYELRSNAALTRLLQAPPRISSGKRARR